MLFRSDTVALIKTAQDHAAPLRIVEAVAAVNDARKRAMARKVAAALGGELRGKTVAVLGLTFKPNTDDMREAPSLVIVEQLLQEGVRLQVHDPVAMHEAKNRLGPTVTYFENNYEALKGADALLVVTEWNEFRRPDFERMRTLMKAPVIFDGRNIYDPPRIRDVGFTYYGIGRGGA